ncbi:MAG: type 1 glutamine amidotransferase domain-containing protein [Candidatus Zixiibacteriota bacterium]
MKTVGILVESDYQTLEVWYPLYRLREAGHRVVVIGTGSASSYLSKNGYPIKAERVADEVNTSDLDAIVIPGGWAPDHLRRYPGVVELVRQMHAAGKPVAAICHAGWVLVSAGILRGKRATSYVAIQDDMIAAGAQWVDAECVVDGNLITARMPDDLPAFMRALLATVES